MGNSVSCCGGARQVKRPDTFDCDPFWKVQPPPAKGGIATNQWERSEKNQVYEPSQQPEGEHSRSPECMPTKTSNVGPTEERSVTEEASVSDTLGDDEFAAQDTDEIAPDEIRQVESLVADDVSEDCEEVAADTTCLDTPGLYQIVKDKIVVTHGASIESQEVAELAIGTDVQVVEVVVLPNEEQVRGRIVPQIGITPSMPEGWVSLHDAGDGCRCAVKFQATTEDAPGLYEIAKDCTAVTRCVSIDSAEIAKLPRKAVRTELTCSHLV